MSGFAYQDKPGPETYLPQSDGGQHKPVNGITVSDLPAGKPRVRPRPKIKGVPDPAASDPDYQPGHGTWRPA